MSRTRFGQLTLLALLFACGTLQNALAEDAGGDPQRPIEAGRSRVERCEAPLTGEVLGRTELFFGLSRPGGVVSEEEFRDFVEDYVSVRFPDGLTLLTGAGQFRDGAGITATEKAKLMILLYPLRAERATERIEEIRTEYKRRFDQQSVLRADAISCVSF